MPDPRATDSASHLNRLPAPRSAQGTRGGLRKMARLVKLDSSVYIALGRSRRPRPKGAPGRANARAYQQPQGESRTDHQFQFGGKAPRLPAASGGGHWRAWSAVDPEHRLRIPRESPGGERRPPSGPTPVCRLSPKPSSNGAGCPLRVSTFLRTSGGVSKE